MSTAFWNCTVFSSLVGGDCYLKNPSCYLTRRGIDVVLVTVGNTSGKKQVLQMVSEAEVVTGGKSQHVTIHFLQEHAGKPFLRKDLEQLIFKKVDRNAFQSFYSRNTWFWPLGV